MTDLKIPPGQKWSNDELSAMRHKILAAILRDPVLGHQLIFERSHADATPLFHHAMVRRFYAPHTLGIELAFRGGGKSSVGEESIIVQAAWGDRFKNVVIVGESEQRAVDRMKRIKREFEDNEVLHRLFEVYPGGTWTETKILLSNGVFIQAYGRSQSLRGTKYIDARPDFVLVDDLEDEESVLTPALREKTADWFVKTLLPAMEPKGRLRMLATPLDPEALAVKLSRTRGWEAHVTPIRYADPATGEMRATWPARFPLEAIAVIEQRFLEQGKVQAFSQEYMCQAIDPATRTFVEGMFTHIVASPPRRRHPWMPVYAMIDPARTTHSTSATTGVAVWSWLDNRLVVWHADAQRWMPDRIVEEVFRLTDEFSPINIGIEEDGLNEFLLQPIRHRAAQAHITLPLRPVRAPRSKLDFIRGLQPFFKAGEVEFAVDLPELRNQLLGFPTGVIDTPNALAYALLMRPGLRVLVEFDETAHVHPLSARAREPAHLCVEATGSLVTAVLVQISQGRLAILRDWMVEGSAHDNLHDVVKEAAAAAGRKVEVHASPHHFEPMSIYGLRGAAARIPLTVRRGGDPVKGRAEIAEYMRRKDRFAISPDATWTLRALVGGYYYGVDKRTGLPGDEPVENAYRSLMLGLEAFAGLIASSSEDTPDIHYEVTEDGRRFASAMSGPRR